MSLGRIAWICRGAPGLGRVTPSVALERTCPISPRPASIFLSYLVGARHLRALGHECIDLGPPSGHAVDPLGSQGEIVVRELRRTAPALVVIDGEPQLIPLVRALGLPVAVLANPHDLFGEQNHFRLTTCALADLADVVLVGALEPSRFPSRDNGTMPRVHITSPAVKPVVRQAGSSLRRPRVLVTLGGGSVNGGARFQETTNRVSTRILEALCALDSGALGSVTYAPGHDGPAVVPWSEHVEVLNRHYDLVDRIASSDVVITRGGRNTIAESLSAGVGLIVVPLHDDPLRGSEQLANAEAAERLGNATVMHFDALNPEGVADAISGLLERGTSAPSARFSPGNTAMWDALLSSLNMH